MSLEDMGTTGSGCSSLFCFGVSHDNFGPPGPKKRSWTHQKGASLLSDPRGRPTLYDPDGTRVGLSGIEEHQPRPELFATILSFSFLSHF